MLKVEGIEKGEYLEYKGRPLVRKEEEIYYGDLSSSYVKMLIMSEDKILVQLFMNDSDKIERQFVANGLSDALQTASVWLA